MLLASMLGTTLIPYSRHAPQIRPARIRKPEPGSKTLVIRLNIGSANDVIVACVIVRRSIEYSTAIGALFLKERLLRPAFVRPRDAGKQDIAYYSEKGVGKQSLQFGAYNLAVVAAHTRARERELLITGGCAFRRNIPAASERVADSETGRSGLTPL